MTPHLDQLAAIADLPGIASKSLRIGHVTDGYWPRIGGIERQVQGLARVQAAAGHQVSVVTLVDGPTRDGDVAVQRPSHLEPGRGVRGSRAVRSRTGFSIAYRRALSVARAVDPEDYDIVHVHASTFSPLAYLTAARVAQLVPTIITVHSLWHASAPIFRTADALSGWRKWPLNWSAVSEVAVTDLRAVLGAQRRIEVLPNGVDASYWLGPRHHRDEVTIVAVMRLTRRKRGLALIDMMAQLASSGVRLRLIGDGPQREAIQSAIQLRGLSGAVTLLGALGPAEIRQELLAADAFVAPARLESFGVAPLEAQAAGVPVVAFRDSGVADIVVDEQTGLLVQSDAEMVHALRRLCTDDALRTRLAQAAPLRAAHFDWAASAARVEQLYRCVSTSETLSGASA